MVNKNILSIYTRIIENLYILPREKKGQILNRMGPLLFKYNTAMRQYFCCKKKTTVYCKILLKKKEVK